MKRKTYQTDYRYPGSHQQDRNGNQAADTKKERLPGSHCYMRCVLAPVLLGLQTGAYHGEELEGGGDEGPSVWVWKRIWKQRAEGASNRRQQDNTNNKTN
jgi:hypothetical protein